MGMPPGQPPMPGQQMGQPPQQPGYPGMTAGGMPPPPQDMQRMGGITGKRHYPQMVRLVPLVSYILIFGVNSM